MKLTLVNEYQNLVPKVSDVEYQSLKKSIKEDGLWNSIIVNKEGIVLDGHHRFRACQELKIQIKCVIKEFTDKLLEKKFVIECNLKRRQLNDYQKSELGMELHKINADLAKQRLKDKVSSNEATSGRAVQHTADAIGVTRGTFERAKKIIEEAPESVKQKLRDGNPNTSISREYKKINKEQKKKERIQAIKKIQVNLPDTITLHNTEFQKLNIESDTISLIFTDPPYHDKFLHLYEDLAIQAARVLREGGSLICYVGQGNIIEVGKIMEKYGLKFHWPITVKHSGPSASVFGKKILVSCKIMLWFVKGKYEGEFVKDFIQSEFQGKELHEWAQSTIESDYYIKYLTIENEIVYDPFLGSGTFGISAKKLKRQFIGCEVDTEHYKTARSLISSA